MLLFLNDNLSWHQSGIEHAQIKRLKLFQRFNQAAKIVTRQYSNELHQVMQASGIADSDLINLFDYFQHACHLKAHPLTLPDLNLNPNWHAQVNGVNYDFYDGATRVLHVRRRDDNAKTIINVQTFDHFGKLLKVTWYDTRGFASVEQIYDWEGNVAIENYLRPSGELALQKTNFKDHRQQVINNYHLFNWHGQDWHFNDFAEVTRFFYDQLANDEQLLKDGPLGLIVDRAYELGWAVLNMQTRVLRILQLHNCHVNDANDSMHSTLNFNYQYAFDHLNQWDGVIALTKSQQADVKARFGQSGVKIYQIPGPIVSDEVLNAKSIKFKHRQKNLVVMVARLSPEKQQDHLLKAWRRVLQVVPDAKLELWGYANQNFDQQLKQLVAKFHVEHAVKFGGYTSEVGKIYDRAQLLVLPSRVEGLPLTLVEAQSHGLPIIANDIKYGPADVVTDQQNGILTQNGDIDGLAQAIIELLTNQAKLKTYSKQAYVASRRYASQPVMQQWAEVLADLKKGQ